MRLASTLSVDQHLATLARWSATLGCERPGSLRDWLLAARERSSLCVARERDHDLWIVRWPPGAIAKPHTHHAAVAAAVVVEGALVERAQRGGQWMSSSWCQGHIELLPRDFIHQLSNRSDRVAYSLHLHAPGLRLAAVPQCLNDTAGSGTGDPASG